MLQSVRSRGFVLLYFFMGGCVGIEVPNYKVLKDFDSFEVRQYPSQMVAEVTVKGDFHEAGNQGFRLLAGYIFGKNRVQQSISMTAPVDLESQNISMTAPVDMVGGQGAYLIRFYMPREFQEKTLPNPLDSRVKLRRKPPVVMAARTYSGWWSQAAFLENKEALLSDLKIHGIEIHGDPIFARYNGPYSIWFLRRNEVLYPVAFLKD